jgi:hypothetical protein
MPSATVIECQAGQMLTGPLGGVYTITGQAIRKYDREGRYQAEYSDNQLGAITYADVSNPMRILLFYEDFNQILFLDNYLAPLRSPVLLDELGIRYARMACSSAQNGFWVFDQQSYALVRFDENLDELHRSPSLNMLAGLGGEISQMSENNNRLFIASPGTGIYQFDIYGTYLKTIAIPDIEHFQAKSGGLRYLSGGHWLHYSSDLVQTDTLANPCPGAKGVQQNAGQTYCHYPDRIEIR